MALHLALHGGLRWRIRSPKAFEHLRRHPHPDGGERLERPTVKRRPRHVAIAARRDHYDAQAADPANRYLAAVGGNPEWPRDGSGRRRPARRWALAQVWW